jgi:hypothetical protein
MFSDNVHPHPSSYDAFDSSLRFGMMFAEIWREWFAAMSDAAYQTHRAYEFLAQNGGPLNRQFGAFDFRPSRNPSEGPNGSIDMDKLRQCLQSLDPTQASQVVHAVQMMQAMDTMRQRQATRGKEAEETTW